VWQLEQIAADAAVIPKKRGLTQAEEYELDTNAAKNEVKVMVVMDLAAICEKLAENSVVPNNLRVEACELVAGI